MSLPTKQQLIWADCEIGLIIHCLMQSFDHSFNYAPGHVPPPERFSPERLDTDQWLECALAAGAKYAILTAKHVTGFCLWPTRVPGYEYHVGNSGCKRDIVKEFIRSCEKYNIKPGLYYSLDTNFYRNVQHHEMHGGGASAWLEYVEVVKAQLRELWKDYGALFEIWVDGGVIRRDAGGEFLNEYLSEFQANAIRFQGPKDLPGNIRWVGNEDGSAPDPCWSTADFVSNVEDGEISAERRKGCFNGPIWVPAETDTPNRKLNSFCGGWAWHENNDDALRSVDDLVECYYSSVGRNTNLLLGLSSDNTGLIANADFRQLAEFGARIKQDFSQCVARTKDALELNVPAEYEVKKAVVMEDQGNGQKIRSYRLEWSNAGNSKLIEAGECIGHKRIIRFPALKGGRFRLSFYDALPGYKIKEFSLYQ